MKNKKIEKRAAISSEFLGWWIIALAVLVVIVIIVIFVIKPKSIGIVDYIKNLFRFGRG